MTVLSFSPNTLLPYYMYIYIPIYLFILILDNVSKLRSTRYSITVDNALPSSRETWSSEMSIFDKYTKIIYTFKCKSLYSFRDLNDVLKYAIDICNYNKYYQLCGVWVSLRSTPCSIIYKYICAASTANLDGP